MIELFETNILKILTLFSISPGSRFNRKLIKEKTRMPNIILDKTLNKLLNFKILLREGNFYTLNFKNINIQNIIKPISENYIKFKQLALKEYFIMLHIFKEISEIKNLGDAYLFGSYAKLIFKENSDIDIAIISEEVNKKEVKRTINKLEKKYKKNIEIHYFTKKFYVNKRDPLVKEILQHGIKLI